MNEVLRLVHRSDEQHFLFAARAMPAPVFDSLWHGKQYSQERRES
jgi:hypothetical protein